MTMTVPYPDGHCDETIDDLIEDFGTWKNGMSKAIGITRSVASWTSIIASLLLIWVLCRSHIKLSSTFHRLLLGICISDIMYCMGGAHFNYLAPLDSNYMVWNANGSERTCDAIGFITACGFFSSLLYSSSLNMYSLIVLKFKKSDEYIKSNVEIWLHVVPVSISVAFSVLFLVGGNFNDDNTGVCWVDSSGPPHCNGCEPGQIREGFEIQCGRGNGTRWSVLPTAILFFLLVEGMIPVMLVCIYQTVRQHERRYSTVSGLDDISMSWMVLSRVCGYSVAYLLMFGMNHVWYEMNACLVYPFTFPAWFVILENIIVVLLGLFHFVIYMHPRIMLAMESGNCNGCQAIWVALWWRGPPLNAPENVTEMPNPLQSPCANVQQESTGQGPAFFSGCSTELVDSSIAEGIPGLEAGLSCDGEQMEVEAQPESKPSIAAVASSDEVDTVGLRHDDQPERGGAARDAVSVAVSALTADFPRGGVPADTIGMRRGDLSKREGAAADAASAAVVGLGSLTAQEVPRDVSTRGKGPTSPFGFLTRNNILMGAEIELVNRKSTQNNALEQVADVPNTPQRPQASMQQDVGGQEPAGTNGTEISFCGEQETTGQRAVSVQENNVDVQQQSQGLSPFICQQLPVAEEVEEEKEESGYYGRENSRFKVLQHILQAGVVEATLESEDEEDVLSERTHLLQKMSTIGLIYKNNNSNV